jgi:RNA polymerase sigma-70 factor, ECF subfamily
MWRKSSSIWLRPRPSSRARDETERGVPSSFCSRSFLNATILSIELPAAGAPVLPAGRLNCRCLTSSSSRSDSASGDAGGTAGLVSDDVSRRFYAKAGAGRWNVSHTSWSRTLNAGMAKAFPGDRPSARDIERHLNSLHLEDLALACALADGHETAWEHFLRAHRPVLYRAADAIDPHGGARELADALYADLYGVTERGGRRRSLLDYFHGRSSLATWLRAVLAQRHVDRIRTERRHEPLPADELSAAAPAASAATEVQRHRWLALLEKALTAAVTRLAAPDRLRLRCYYAQGMTLAQIAPLMREHEATVSRNLARTRKAIRADVERQLRTDEGLADEAIAECFEAAIEDPGSLDLGRVIARGNGERKESTGYRSIEDR